jgi:hypothetical protein
MFGVGTRQLGFMALLPGGRSAAPVLAKDDEAGLAVSAIEQVDGLAFYVRAALFALSRVLMNGNAAAKPCFLDPSGLP